ncbi:hypothetical protein [Acinetobacter equi]|uniref:DUF4175 domain-containing protein n=1 Tax=Acinetobacter equi TaxID=1324350 RepID=A0A0N9VCM8_9GAMM|nr:hypothetical protein [Acinetobacter equi]ALH94837.1 hypothetical protein AOY20_04420 [Acinetobacter equi]
MNAPRQGLFASLLIVSFILQTFILVLATTHQLNENRANQGQLITSQLVTDSLSELEPANTVSLALLAGRFATNPNIASIRILDANNQVLATGGMSKTREGEIFVRDALLNEKKIGRIEITLIKPSIGEILRTQWLAILASFIIYVFLWLVYRAIARPSRTEYLTRINREKQLNTEIQQLTHAIEQQKHNAALVIAQAQGSPHSQKIAKDPKQEYQEDHSLALNIQFYDPKQLLDTVTPSVSTPYFNLCQIFLNKSIELCVQHYKLNCSDIKTIQAFNAEGTTISILANKPNAAECLTMISTVFQLLSEVLYKRYREDKRFVLQTRSAISSEVEAMQLSSAQAASRLVKQLSAKESAVHLPKDLLKTLSTHYELMSFPSPTNVLTRHAFMINGMDIEYAELAQNIRTEILKAK